MIPNDQNTRDHSAWTIGDGDPIQYTSRMGTAGVKEEEKTDTDNAREY